MPLMRCSSRTPMMGTRHELIFRLCQRIFSNPRGNSRPPAFFRAWFISGSTRHKPAGSPSYSAMKDRSLSVINLSSPKVRSNCSSVRGTAPSFSVQASRIYRTDDELGVLKNKIGNVAQLLRKVLSLKHCIGVQVLDLTKTIPFDQAGIVRGIIGHPDEGRLVKGIDEQSDLIIHGKA